MSVAISPVFFSDRAFAEHIGLGLTSFRDRVRAGVIPPPIKIGRRSLWPRSDIDKFAQDLIEQRNAKRAA